MADRPPTPNYHPLVRGVARALRERCGVGEGDALVVACSGGADSVALLRALAILAQRRRWKLRLVVGHVQHHLRGDAAEADADFVAALASKLGLGYARRDIHPGDEPGNLEANARKARYHALVDIALQRQARYVATAHHADDQLETVLMRFLRGAGVEGLRGIAWRRRLRTEEPDAHIYAIRPMLASDRDSALGLLQLLDQPYREDATNFDTTRTRARLRHDVIPLLKQIRADAAGKAVTLTDQFDHLHALVQSQVQAVNAKRTELDSLSRIEARTLNPMVLTQMLRSDLIHAGVNKDSLPGHALHPVIEAVRDTAGGVRTFDFAGGVTIEVGPDAVSVVKG